MKKKPALTPMKQEPGVIVLDDDDDNGFDFDSSSSSGAS